MLECTPVHHQGGRRQRQCWSVHLFTTKREGDRDIAGVYTCSPPRGKETETLLFTTKGEGVRDIAGVYTCSPPRGQEAETVLECAPVHHQGGRRQRQCWSVHLFTAKGAGGRDSAGVYTCSPPRGKEAETLLECTPVHHQGESKESAALPAHLHCSNYTSEIEHFFHACHVITYTLA